MVEILFDHESQKQLREEVNPASSMIIKYKSHRSFWVCLSDTGNFWAFNRLESVRYNSCVPLCKVTKTKSGWELSEKSTMCPPTFFQEVLNACEPIP